MIRLICVDDHAIVREGIARVINRQTDMRVVASAATAEDGLELFHRHRPDLTLMDLRLPFMSGLDAIRRIRRIDSDARILVLTMYEGDEDIRRATEAGAAAYLLKTTLTDDLVRIVRQVHGGERPLMADVAATLSEHSARARLTPREVEVVELVSLGQRNKEIAASLHISEDTVEAHMKNVFTKLAVRDRSAAVKVAIKRGILHVN
jgi:DNA-binding NarL/FixJ family response regulator